MIRLQLSSITEENSCRTTYKMKWCISLIAISISFAAINGAELVMTGVQALPNIHTMPAPTFPNILGYPNGMGQEEPIPCSCGVFLSGQFRRGSGEPPRGNAALLQELTEPFACNAMGEKQCANKCIETIMKHLANSAVMVCGSIDRDCYRERAHLFVKNCRDKWINTNLSAGREYCCKDGAPYKCNH